MREPETFAELMYKALLSSPRGMAALALCRQNGMDERYTALAVVQAVVEERKFWEEAAMRLAETQTVTYQLHG